MNEPNPSVDALPLECIIQNETGDKVFLQEVDSRYEFAIQYASGGERVIVLSEEQWQNLQIAIAKNKSEIESKFLVEQLPESLWQYSRAEIKQHYLVIWVKDEVRIREKIKEDTTEYTLTIKIGTGSTRGEFETFLTQEQHEALLPWYVGNPIEKVRFDIPCGVHTLELDLYTGSLIGHATAEVEFPSEYDRQAFTKPGYLWLDVSNDARMKNKNLALQGFPDGL